MRPERAGQPARVVPVEKVVPVAKLRIVGERRQRQRRAARPAPDAAGRQPDHVGRIFLPLDANRFALHELPEPDDVLLKLPIDDVGTVQAEIVQPRVSMIGIVEGGQHPVGINLGRHGRRRWHDPVVVRVPEDELAGGNAFTADAGDGRLCDAVVKAKRFMIPVGPVAALHRAGELGHATCRLGEQRTLCLAGAFERSRRDRMNDDDRMNRRLCACRRIPSCRGRFLPCRRESSNGARASSLPGIRPGTCRARASAGASAARPSAVNAMLHASVGLSFSPVRCRRPRPGRGDGRRNQSQPPSCRSGFVKVDEQVRGVRQMPVAARDEALDVGEDIIGQSRRGCRRHHTRWSRPRSGSPAAPAHACAKARSLTTFSTVSSGYALKKISAGT